MFPVNRGFFFLTLIAVAMPILGVLFVYESGSSSVIVGGAPWVNWATYIIGFSLAAIVCGIGANIMHRKSMLMLAYSFTYWAIGCSIGALQTGNNPPLQPTVALPYVRMMWMMGSAAMILAAIGILKRVVRIVPSVSDGERT